MAPADTSMMRIVHDALRRDLARARVTLGSSATSARQRTAVHGHLRWMMRFLERHHRSEDEGLYPLVRERDPSAGRLLDDMARDHEAVARAVATVEAAVAEVRSAENRTEVVSALDELTEVLLPHLRREEDQAMPVVTATITNGEWAAIEQAHNLAGKSMPQLAREGHWLIDGATAEDRATVLGLVPPVPRFVLLHGFGASYRRRRRACWGTVRSIQHSGAVQVVVDAPIEAVWEVVRDPTRVGEWSHECVEGTWVGPVHEPRPGARFRGRNRQGVIRWGRVCEVVRVDSHELVWRTVPTRLYPDSTEWALCLEAVEEGTVIEQTFRVVKGSWLEPVYASILPAHRDRTEALRQDLGRIGELAAAVASRR